MKSTKSLLIIVLLLAIGAIACNLGSPPANGDQTVPPAQEDDGQDVQSSDTGDSPTDTPEPSPTPMIWEGLEIQIVEEAAVIDIENISATKKTPQLTGVVDPRVDMFNTTAESIIADELQAFLALSDEIEVMPDFPWFMTNEVNVHYLEGGLVSLLLDFSTFTGGAHPNSYSVALNYDLNTSHQLTLDELFTPGADYLTLIANAAKTELETNGYLDFPEGADPTPENYEDWNISSDGLLITFEAYQVAPYAVGPQTVTIPYATLAPIIDPVGPVGRLMP